MAVSIAIILSFALQQQDSSSYRSKAPVVCIDPGHPSEVSSGAELQNGTTEVHIVWMVSLKLQKLLEAEDFKVMITKSKEDELVKNKDGGVRGDSKTLVGSRQGALTGSIFSQVPVVTIEMVVLSNKSDAAFIKSEDGQVKMARAIAAGVKRFLNH